jgi:hypothetical protein
MKVLYNWLKEFVDVTAAPAELRSRLSLSGTAVDSIEESSLRIARIASATTASRAKSRRSMARR